MLPRDVSGQELARFGHAVTRQSGSHLRLTSRWIGVEHHVTMPNHDSIRVGTLSAMLADVAEYLELPRARLVEQLWG